MEIISVKQIVLPSALLESLEIQDRPFKCHLGPRVVLCDGECRERKGRARLGGTFCPWSLPLTGFIPEPLFAEGNPRTSEGEHTEPGHPLGPVHRAQPAHQLRGGRLSLELGGARGKAGGEDSALSRCLGNRCSRHFCFLKLPSFLLFQVLCMCVSICMCIYVCTCL